MSLSFLSAQLSLLREHSPSVFLTKHFWLQFHLPLGEEISTGPWLLPEIPLPLGSWSITMLLYSPHLHARCFLEGDIDSHSFIYNLDSFLRWWWGTLRNILCILKLPSSVIRWNAKSFMDIWQKSLGMGSTLQPCLAYCSGTIPWNH